MSYQQKRDFLTYTRYVENILVMGGTLFKHRTIHKTTWRSPDGNFVSQIDHVIINQKWRWSFQDVRARRGADVVGSHHVLVVATLSLKLRKANRGGERQRRFDTERLKNTNTRKAFQPDLQNRCCIHELATDSFNQVLKETSKKVLGYRRKQNREQQLKKERQKRS